MHGQLCAFDFNKLMRAEVKIRLMLYLLADYFINKEEQIPNVLINTLNY